LGEDYEDFLWEIQEIVEKVDDGCLKDSWTVGDVCLEGKLVNLWDLKQLDLLDLMGTIELEDSWGFFDLIRCLVLIPVVLNLSVTISYESQKIG
jgi:hypothetical protein